MRKSRDGEHTCRCRAYRFPHRFGGGRCSGAFIAEEYWEQHYGQGDCAQCTQNAEGHCEVVEGKERIDNCVVWQEFVHYNGVKI